MGCPDESLTASGQKRSFFYYNMFYCQIIIDAEKLLILSFLVLKTSGNLNRVLNIEINTSKILWLWNNLFLISAIIFIIYETD